VTPEQAFNLGGLHSVSLEKLRGLDKEALFRLHQTGFLHGAFLVAASIGNMRKLIAMKQAKLRSQVQRTSAGG
jgi:hypothetical protein